MEENAVRMQCAGNGRSSSLDDVAVKMSCFGFGGKKKTKVSSPSLAARCPGAPDATTSHQRESKLNTARATATDGHNEDAMRGDASPRHWDSWKPQDYFRASAGPADDCNDSAHQYAGEEEGTDSQSDREPAATLTMHDSTSSLKEGLHGKAKLQAFAGQLSQTKAMDGVEEDEHSFLQSEWEIDPRDIAFCSRETSNNKTKLLRLGRGAFGTVYKGVWKGETVAVKVCRQQHVSMKAMKQFQKEVAILHGCDHDSIVQFKGACCWKGGKRTVLVTEYMERGDLCTAMGRSPGRYCWGRLGRRIALDVARGLEFLHAANIVHFDLKSANILLDQDNRAKIADVGLAKTLTHSHGSDHLSTFMATGDLGTFAWAAPEVLLGFPCDAKADIFSFGVVMWELATTEMPQGRCLRPLRVPEEASDEVADLIMDCLRHDANARPSAEKLVDVLGRMQ